MGVRAERKSVRDRAVVCGGGGGGGGGRGHVREIYTGGGLKCKYYIEHSCNCTPSSDILITKLDLRSD